MTNLIPGNATSFPANIRAPSDADLRNATTENLAVQDIADRTAYLLNRVNTGRYQRISSTSSTTGGLVATSDGTIITPGSASGGVFVLNRSGAIDNGMDGASTYEIIDLDRTYTTTVRDDSPTGPILATVGGTGIARIKCIFFSGYWQVIEADEVYLTKQIVIPSHLVTYSPVLFTTGSTTPVPVQDIAGTPNLLRFSINGVQANEQMEFMLGPFTAQLFTSGGIGYVEAHVSDGTNTRVYTFAFDSVQYGENKVPFYMEFTHDALVTADHICTIVALVNNGSTTITVSSPQVTSGTYPVGWPAQSGESQQWGKCTVKGFTFG